jgi:hypothetical protein
MCMYAVSKTKGGIDQLISTKKEANRLKKYRGTGYHIYKTDSRYKSKEWGDLKWIKVE